MATNKKNYPKRETTRSKGRNFQRDKLKEERDRKKDEQRIKGDILRLLAAGSLTRKILLDKFSGEVSEKVLDELLEGKVLEEERGVISLPLSRLAVGRLRVHQRGFGFVQRLEKPREIFVPKGNMGEAIDGDLVELVVQTREKGCEGSVVAIKEVGRKTLVGIVFDAEQLIVNVPILSTVVRVDSEIEVQRGDRVLLQRKKKMEIKEVFGSIEEAILDIPVAIEEIGLRKDFPEEALAEAAAYADEVSLLEERKDLRDLICISIDPEGAEDLDDAISLQRDEKGNFHLGVHIADVSHYVGVESALDREAFLRGNSTYFPGDCLPMLPPKLSEQLCSLKAEKTRLAMSALMKFNSRGELLSSEIVPTTIINKRAFRYEEVQAILDGKEASDYSGLLSDLKELCFLLKEHRRYRGNVEIDLPETSIEVDEKGNALGVHKIPYDLSHQIVENCMLQANETVANYLATAVPKQIYRVHAAPLEKALDEFYAFARLLGFSLPHNPSQSDLQHLFREAKETPAFEYLATRYVRSMKLAVYSPINEGHYGLGLECYAHFTSPIRRYSDLITHRLLKGIAYSAERLDEIAFYCSDKERLSMRAEMGVKSYKKLRLLRQWHLENPNRHYLATIVTIKQFGLFFDLQELAMESFIHVSQLGDDYFAFDETRETFQGRNTSKLYRAGMSINVSLLHVDLIAAQTRWQMI